MTRNYTKKIDAKDGETIKFEYLVPANTSAICEVVVVLTDDTDPLDSALTKSVK